MRVEDGLLGCEMGSYKMRKELEKFEEEPRLSSRIEAVGFQIERDQAV